MLLTFHWYFYALCFISQKTQSVSGQRLNPFISVNGICNGFDQGSGNCSLWVAACFSKCSFSLEYCQLIHLHTVHGCFLTAAVTTGTTWLSGQKYLLSDILRNNLLISGLDLDRDNQNCVELNQVDCKVSFNSLMMGNIVPEFMLVAFLSGHEKNI